MLTALITIYALGAFLMMAVLGAYERLEHKKCPFLLGFSMVLGWPVFAVCVVGYYLFCRFESRA